MARKKQQKKKRNKKYQQKYTTGGRVDMSKGGRVGYQLGKMVQDPSQEELSIQRQDEPMPNLPPIQGNQPVLTGDMKDLTAGGQQGPALDKMPVDQQQRPDRSNMVFAGNTGDNFSENLTNASMRVDDVMDGRQGGPQGDSNRFTVGQTRTLPNGTVLVWNGTSWVIQSGGGANNTTTDIPVDQMTDAQKQAKFESERNTRIIETGQTAQDIAAGNLPEGMIPEQELVNVSQGEEYEAGVIELAERKGVTPEYIKEVGPEIVEQMEDISTVKTPEPSVTSTMNAKTVGEDVSIEYAKGEIRDEALAKVTGVDKVAPVEGVEVEIEPGALAERVVGELSPEAKASAAQVAGTSLARITRAKKQLRNAGLSEEDITELGSDPEELEAKLTEFTEEQRGMIAGLPKEALVSNQIDSLLSGMENGEIPAWARPAVANVEAMLAKRGLSASSVGRDNLFNAIQQSISQQKSIEAQTEIENAKLRQQTALSNADKVFNLNMAQFSADQQTELSNSKFMQTVSLAEASNEQQATIQNAVLMSQANLTEANIEGQRQIQNAKNFLAMDMQNLSNEQQTVMVQSQQEQQRLLSNQAAQNAARQFNATSENQMMQFMANLNTQISQFNSQQINASKQFNAQQSNAAEARRAGREADLNKANAAIVNQTKQFNETMDFNRDQFNTQNALAIQQSNVEWRRRANLADTAAQNAINQENAKMAYGMTTAAQAFLWQELRDQADYNFRWANDSATRKVQAMIAAASAEGDVAKNWTSNFNNISSTINTIFGIG